ncbi:MAG: MarR family winged helix-turn-helix transcriptional regulator [Planctomycetales bacterium]
MGFPSVANDSESNGQGTNLLFAALGRSLPVMTISSHELRPPHFPLAALGTGGTPQPSGSTPHLTADQTSATDQISVLLQRGAECLGAAFAEGTAAAGLNESRYRVLAALNQRSAGECFQAELADSLLQSESNLSTLLERMSGDGLISRTRSTTDRRRSLIRITAIGQDALHRAERARTSTAAKLLKQFTAEEAGRLAAGLSRLVGDLERGLDASVRRASGLDPAYSSPHKASAAVAD